MARLADAETRGVIPIGGPLDGAFGITYLSREEVYALREYAERYADESPVRITRDTRGLLHVARADGHLTTLTPA